MAGWIYFKGQGTPPQLWGRGRIKGEAALSLLYLVADAPEALVTRSYYCAPRPERGPPSPRGTGTRSFNPRDNGPYGLRFAPRTGAPAFTSWSKGPPPRPRLRPAFAPRAGTPARPSWGREGPGRAPASRPFREREKLSRHANAGGNRGHRGGHTARQLAAPRRGRHARRAGPGAPPPSPPTPPGLELPPRAGPAGSPQRRRAESRRNLLEPAALAAQARSVGPPPGWRRGHI